MNSNKKDNSYLAKIIVISIVVLINIIALISVIKTVGKAIKNLDKDIKLGKVNSEQNVTENENEFSETEGTPYEESFEHTGIRLLKLVAENSNVRNSCILIIIGIILIGVAIGVLVKISRKSVVN